MKYYIETLGCQMNKLDSEVVAGVLGRMNYTASMNQEDADVIVLNTCSVRAHAEQKAISKLGHFDYLRRTFGRPMVIAVIGCFAQRSAQEIKKSSPFVDIICGPGELHNLKEHIAHAMTIRQVKQREKAKIITSNFDEIRAGTAIYSDALEALDSNRPIESNTSRYQRFVRIQRGCDNFCSYCVVPYARGPETSRPINNIIKEVKKLDETDCQEITLLGQTVSAYHWTENGKPLGLAELLYRVHEACSIPRIRFITSYPGGFSTDIFHAMAQLDRVCPYLHFPAQHGSDRMLKLMKRKYTIGEYKELLEQGRKIVPNLSLASDFIVGFPTETEDDHRQSVELVQEYRFKNCFVFKYSIRPGTLASKQYGPQEEISEEIVSRRHTEMLETQNKIAEEDNQSAIGQKLRVLVEGRSKKNDGQADGIEQLVGRTETDKIIIFDGPASLIGSITDIKIATVSSLTLFGETITT